VPQGITSEKQKRDLSGGSGGEVVLVDDAVVVVVEVVEVVMVLVVLVVLLVLVVPKTKAAHACGSKDQACGSHDFVRFAAAALLQPPAAFKADLGLALAARAAAKPTNPSIAA
jgi:hypothetical protein